jgi:formamidopyrimidine-DNA glycosylase
MPELPEVETIRRQLEPLVVGRAVVEVWAFEHPKFTPAVHAIGRAVEHVRRRGKFLLLGLDDGNEIVIHLGMTGQLRLRPNHEPVDPYVRAWWGFADGDERLEYRDVRRFGRIRLASDGAYEGTLATQGPDGLDGDLDAVTFWHALRRSTRAIKTQLMSQRPIAGVGNIYADEALWIARVHPASRTITRAQAVALLDAVREVLRASVDRRGTTLRDYRGVDEEPGTNQLHLRCYGRAGEPCERCGTALRRITLDARTSTFCPTCQRRR